MDHLTHLEHEPSLVMISYFISFIAAYASIDLANRVKSTTGLARNTWLISGATALGIGIWSMHFIAMLAYDMPFPVYYNAWIVLFSIVAAIAGCLGGFYAILSGKRLFILAGLLMGTGIVSMHYIGMHALIPVNIEYNPFIVTVSIIIAIGIALFAIWIGFLSPYSEKRMPLKRKLTFSFFMGIGISSMHYVGMGAAKFKLDENIIINNESNLINIDIFQWIIIIITFVIFFLVFFTIFYDRILRRAIRLQGLLLDSTEEGVIVTDENNQVLEGNQAFYLQFGTITSDKNLIHNNFVKLIDEIGSSKKTEKVLSSVTLEVNQYPLPQEAFNHTMWIIRDISKKKLSDKILNQLAFYDSITELPNQYQLDQRLINLESESEKIACVFIEFDRLNFTNETLGHQAGDQLIREMATRIKESLIDGDLLFKYDTKSFIILLLNDRVRETESILKSLVKKMDEPFTVKGGAINITIHIGLSRFPSQASEGQKLIRYANWAMLTSKSRGKNQITTFDHKIEEAIIRRLKLEDALIHAIENEEFHLVYQPKINIKTNKFIGMEALLRWNQKELGFISPGEFIPIAEETGKIYRIGDWVMRKAFAEWSNWVEAGNKPICLAINISPLQFSRDEFLPNLKSIIEASKMDPNFVELEITESSSINYESKMIEKLYETKKLGVHISLDDFGTGYSSFGHLKELPVDVLKIDRSFLNGLQSNKNNEAILRSMIQLGHNLNLKVLMEGVETIEDVKWLEAETCDYVQGFYYSRPKLLSELYDWSPK
ncbi:bifunctional diguanylate cyclase/phosphodiesterase [Saliterribacillus persicus]|uniref:Diguanylate cyclase/phosphodiesterase n=1 Tax=Saliterribacillus persicus TaxID=930114 RepID=A0A368Y134_9BACI|nr:EAL domain-containing protein [Saliterribacillus persicus]RCW71964.1 diguanylate cyclase/phosphodiesterase [Saliterribacillus persicus]